MRTPPARAAQFLPPANDNPAQLAQLRFTDYQTAEEFWETDMPGAVALLDAPAATYAADTLRAAALAAEIGAEPRGSAYPRAVWALLYR